MQTVPSRLRIRSISSFAIGATMLGSLVGCAMPDSSNPTLSITRAQVVGDRATLEVEIQNPSDMELRIESVDWSLVHGPLPVASGEWTVGETVASKEAIRFVRQVSFTTSSLDPASRDVELSGVINTSGAGGNMAITETGFVANGKIQR